MADEKKATTNLKPCPLMIAAPNIPSAMCIGSDCAWWCGFANDCAIPLLAGMFADSEICRNIFEEQEGN